jgi:hypothetical protein
MNLSSAWSLAAVSAFFATTVWLLAWRKKGASINGRGRPAARVGARMLSAGSGLIAAGAVLETPRWGVVPSASWLGVGVLLVGGLVFSIGWFLTDREPRSVPGEPA